MDDRPTIGFLTRPGCHLCDEARVALQFVLEERGAAGRLPAVVREVDIASDPALERRHLERIPVLVVGGEDLPLATSSRAIRAFLERTLDGRLA
ncbi:MAG: glutaredoxin family protein [Candidatus Limnocylindrales bacterium]